MIQRLLSGPILIALAMLFAAGCSRKSSTEKLLVRANQFYETRELEKAKILYIAVLRKEAQNTNAIAGLGRIFFRQGQMEESFPFLAEAHRQQPDDLELAGNLATVYLSSGDPAGLGEARTLARAVLARQPTNETSIGVLIDAATKGPELDKVFAEVDALERRTGPSASLRVARAMLLAKRADAKGSEAELQRAIATDPKSVMANLTLGQLRWRTGQTNQAEEFLRKAAAAAPPDHAAQFQLAGFLLRSGRVPEAKKLVEEIIQRAPERTAALVMRAEIALSEKEFEEGIRLANRASSQAPNDFSARLIQARLKLALKQPAEAVDILKRVVDRHPQVAEASYQLGLAQMANNEAAEAAKSFARVEILDANDARPVVMLAEMHLGRGEADLAVTKLRDLVRRQPDLLGAQFLLGRAYTAAGKLDDGIDLFRSANARQPGDPAILYRLGTMLAQRGAFAEARKVLLEAQAKVPGDLTFLEQLVEVDLAENPAAAAERLKPVLEQNPKSTRLWLLQAKIHAQQKQWDAAEKSTAKAIEIDPAAPAGYLMSAELSFKRGDPKASIGRLAELLQRDAKNVGALTYTAMLQENIGAFDDARKTYEELLKVQPENLLALNNLAYLVSERLGRPDDAFVLAGKASKLAPEDPSVADTFGWIEYRRGNYAEALRALGKAVSKPGQGPEAYAHLGLAAYMSGEETAARQALTVALKSTATFPARELAAQCLAFLNQDATRMTTADLAGLERRRRDEPKDPIVALRLGIAYEAAGDLAKAREAFQAAHQLSPSAFESLRRLASIEVDRDLAKALELARHAQRLSPNDPVVNRTLGRLALASGDATTAYGLLTSSARQITNQAAVWQDLGRAAFGVGRLQESEDAMRRALSLGVGPATNAATQWVQLLLLAKAPAAGKVPLIEPILKREPTNGPALYAMGMVREADGDFAGARDAHEKLLQAYPAFMPSVRQLALLYADRLGQDEKAYGLATRARTVYPADEPLARALAALSFRRGDFRYAAQLYEELAKGRPADGNFQFQLGVCRVKLKQATEARSALQKAQALEPKGAFVEEAKKLLKELGPG